MMIKSHRENEGHHKKQDQNAFILRANDEQAKETDQQYYQFCSDDIGEDCPDEKAVLAFEERQAFRAVVPDMKRVRDDRCLTTGRTTQPQTATEDPFDLF